MGFATFINNVGKVIGRTAQVGKAIGGFIARNHQHIAPLAHGLAMASGHEGLQRVTGAGLALSQGVQMGKSLTQAAGDVLRQRIQAYRDRVAPAQPPPNYAGMGFQNTG